MEKQEHGFGIFRGLKRFQGNMKFLTELRSIIQRQITSSEILRSFGKKQKLISLFIWPITFYEVICRVVE